MLISSYQDTLICAWQESFEVISLLPVERIRALRRGLRAMRRAWQETLRNGRCGPGRARWILSRFVFFGSFQKSGNAV
jgi:hypothetical protein